MGYDCLFCKVSLWLLEGEWSVEEETRQEAAGTSLMVQWLRLGLQMQGVWVWSLVRKLRSHTSSVQFSRSVVSDSLRSHESQHTRPPCPSPTPGVHSDSHPSSQWWHPAISSSVIPFSSCPQTLPASESFPMSQLFTWGGQSTEVSALASVLPKNTQSWSPLEWTGWISLQSKGLTHLAASQKTKHKKEVM